MKIVVAMDAFKGSLTSLEAGNSVKKGIYQVFPQANICVFPLADGGEGTLDAVLSFQNGKRQKVKVKDALLRPLSTEYGLFSSHTALIEVAKVVGLPLLKKEERHPLMTSTYGIGEMIINALKHQVQSLYIGLGGSATNDGGLGMLRALGYRFLDRNQQEIHELSRLMDLTEIDDKQVKKEIFQCEYTILSDVNNPLLGKDGCSFVFGSQKGATKEEQAHLEAILAHFSKVVTQQYHTEFHLLEGAGAAGGLGFAFLSFLHAKFKLGSQWILKQLGIEKEISDADYVITGEGKIDAQTLMGKAPVAVAGLAKKYRKKVFGFGGSIEISSLQDTQIFDGLYAVVNHEITAVDLEKETAKKHVCEAVKKVFEIEKNGNSF